MNRIRYLFLLSALVSLFSLTALGQSTINITTSGGSFPTEKWVSITTAINGGGTQVWGQGDGTYGNGQGLINENISIAPGTYYVNCYDRYSDGWDGTLISVTAYSNVIGNNGGVTPNNGADDDATGSWETPADELEASFQIIVPAAPACLPPTSLTATNLLPTSASLGWTANNGETAWEIVVQSSGVGVPTGAGTSISTNPYAATGLTANTAYEYYVKADCGGSGQSGWAGPYSFTTPCLETPDYTEDFTTFLNSCWQEAQGPISGPTSFGSSDWVSDNFGNTGSNGSARFNIWGTNSTGWLITPLFDLTGGGFEINLDVALTPWTGTASSTIGADDAVYVMQSTDAGATWTAIYTWDAANSPSNTGDNISIDVSAVTSATTQFAIYAFEGTTNAGDYRFFIDNFKVRTPPACAAPSSLTATGITATSVTFGWTENGTATQWYGEYGPSGFTPGMGVGNSSGLSTNPITLPSILSPNTTYDFYVKAVCGVGDSSAWAGPVTFTTACNPEAIPWSENFDAMTSVGIGVVPDCMAESGDWTTYTGTGSNNRMPNSGSNYIYINWSADDWLYTPPLTLSGGTSYDFSFYYVTDGNSGWTTLETAMGTAQNSAAMTTTIGTAVSGATNTTYTKYTATFTPAMSGTYYLGIHVVANGSPWYMSFDDLEVKETPTCVEPSALTASSITTTGADLGWTENNAATQWEVEYGPAGFTPGMGTSFFTTTNPHSLSSLSPSTAYDFYVRSVCTAGDTSAWSSAGSFATLCAPFTAPYTESFDGNSTPICWSQSATSGGPWEFSTGSGVNTSNCSGPSDHTGNGGHFAWMDHSGGDGGVILEMYDVDVSALTTPYLELYYWMCGVGYTPANITVVEAWDGTAWQTVSTIQQTTSGWQRLGFVLTGFTYSTNLVKLRFRAESGGSFDDYYGDNVIDDISIIEAPLKDVGVTAATSGNCTSTESVTIDITNFGLNTQTSIPVSYDINGGTAVNETWTGSLASGMTTQYTFTTTYDASAAGTYNINASTALVGDQDNTNDAGTGSVITTPTYSNPYGQDFESNSTDWSYDGVRANGHNSGSTVIYDNLYSGDVTFTVDAPKVGSIATGDIVKFDYRYTNWSAGTVGTTLGSGDTLRVQVSTDCGATFTTIDTVHAGNHVTSASFATIIADLSAYAGQTINVRILVERGTGDYWIDIDNFFIGAPLSATASVSTPLACNGDMNGAVTVAETGGLAPYTYLWDDGMAQTTQTATGLVAGTYNVTVTDALGDMATSTIVLTEPTLLTAGATMASGASCNGASDGSATATGSGGTSGYTYLWDDPMAQTTATATGLAAGTYNVTVTDANGCTAFASATVTEPAVLDVSVGAPFSLDGTTWKMAPQAGALAVGPALGDFSWWSNTAGDVTTRACFFDDEYVFNANGTFSNVLGADTWVENWQSGAADACATPVFPHDGSAAATWIYDANAGTITISGAGAYLGIPKVYNGGELVSPAAAPPSISYPVTFTGDSIMTIDINFGAGYWHFVLKKSAPASTPAITNVSCNGGSDGSAIVSATGGTAPYSYTWDANAGSQTTATATGLAAGTYTVTVTDANNCTDTTSVTITEPAAVDLSVATAPSSLSGTTWKMASQAGALAVGPALNDFSWWTNNMVDVALRGCFFDDEYVFNADGSFSNVLGADTWVENWQSGNPDACATPVAPHDGSAVATWTYDDVAGTITINGTGAYLGLPKVYNGGELSSPAGAVASITYPVTFTGDSIMTIDINFGAGYWHYVLKKAASAPPVLQITNPTCNGGNDGSATVAATGGTAPYTYAWPDGQTTATGTGLAAGTYVVTATDVNGCSDTTSLTLTDPVAVTATAVATQVASCNIGNDGKAMVTGANGTAPYTYLWDANASNQTTQEATGLTAGTYSVTVTDANGCSGETTVDVITPSGLAATATVFNDVSCNGGSDGAINLTATGGAGNYTFAWSNGATTEDLFNLTAGTYDVTVTDGAGCTTTASATVNEPATALTASATGDALDCNGDMDGDVDLTVTGGVGPYAYAWDNGTTTEDLSNVGAGTYNITITDVNGCSTTASATVTEPAALTASTSPTDASCNNTTDGAVDLTVTGGTMPYTYSWDNSATTEDLASLGGGTYNVTITDVNGCSTTASATVNAPSAIVITGTVTDALCNGDANGAVDITVTGGAGGYTFSWDNMATTEDLTNVVAGTYTVTVTDGSGCSDNMSFTVGQPDALSTTGATTTDVNCFGDADGSISVNVSGGTAPYSYAWDSTTIGNNGSPTGLLPGVYSVTITDANMCTTTASFTISAPMAALSLSTSSTNASCIGGNDGSIDLTVTGGTGPYTYAWDNSDTTEDLTNLTAGTYVVVVTDANGCSETTSVTITQPSGISSSSSTTNVACHGDSTGSIQVTVSGGTAPYTYAWSDGSTNEDLTNVSAGTYTLVITDANGCTSSITKTVNEPAPIMIAETITDVSCNGGSDGSIALSVTGGTAPYSMTWSGGVNPTALMAGTYTVTVTDGNGCTEMATYTVGEPTLLLAISAVAQPIACAGDSGMVTVTIGGGTAPYTTVWTDAAGTTVNPNAVVAGTYTANVTDAHGCMTSSTVTIDDPVSVSVDDIMTTDALCAGDANGTIDIVVSGGAMPYTYSWSDPSFGNTANVTNATAGTHTVTVTDANGCSATASATVGEPTALTVSPTSVADTNNLLIGTAIANVAGGTPPYTISWDNGMDGDTITGLGFGTYTVTVVDANGCTTSGSVQVDSILTNIDNVLYSITNLNVFPNPTAGNVTIDLEMSDARDVNVSIYDISGQLIRDFGHEYTSRAQIRTDMSVFPSGVYLVRFVIDNEVITKRLILSKY